MVDSLINVLMERDGLSKEEAEQQIEEAREILFERLDEGEMPFDICEEFFGLEPDYLMDLI
jgi:predicted RNase H-like HicB family nuclease